jgi:uncharacterized protein YeaO (DUF488 family)
MRKKQICMEFVLEAYEDALIRGLCPQGAYEVAMSSIAGVESTMTIDDLDRAMKAASDKGKIRIKRIYEPTSRGDGLRVLVDRLWPRGISKADAHVDEWLKEVAPSNELRKWFGHDPARWSAFQKRYERELNAQADSVDALQALAGKRAVTLLYAAKDEAHNNAVALQNYLLRPRPAKRAKPVS